MNYTRKAVRGTIVVFVMMILAAGLGYLFRLLLARNLSQEEYGLFYAVFALISSLTLFRSLGLGEALIKKIPELSIKNDYQKIKGAILFVLIIQLFFALLISIPFFFLSDYLALNYFHSAAAAPILRILLVAFFLATIEYVYTYTFQGFQNMEYRSLIDFSRSFFVLVITFVFFKYNSSVLVASYAYLITYFILIFLYFPLFLKIFPDFFKIKLKFDKKVTKGMFKFGLYFSLGILGFTILSYADTLLLTYFTDLKQVALYNVAIPLVSLLWYFSRSISTVIYPMSSELWAKRNKNFSKGIETLQKYSFAIIIPVALVMFSFPDIIIRLLFGETYVPAQYALKILAIGAIVYTIMTINFNILVAIGKVKENTFYLLIGAFFNILLNFALIPFFGIVGAAIATSLSYVVVLFLTSLKLKQVVKTRILWKEWLKSLFCGTIFVLIIMILKKILILNVWLELVICVLIALIVYICMLFIIKIIIKKEIMNILNVSLFKK